MAGDPQQLGPSTFSKVDSVHGLHCSVMERLLNMLGLQNMCALAYAAAFVINLVMCFVLVPRFGGYGAAAATTIALIIETALLFWITRSRLDLHVFAFGKRA